MGNLVCFLNVGKTCVDVFGIFSRFLKIFVCSATTGTKTALDIIQLWFNHFAASFFRAFGMRVSREAKEKCPKTKGPSGKCAKVHAVAASSNGDYRP